MASASATATLSAYASTGASASVTAPGISAKPDSLLPFVEANPEGSGELLTGIPISMSSTICPTADVTAAADIPEGWKFTIESVDGQLLAEDEPVATGCIAVVSSGTSVTNYTIVVRGDVLGTGRLDMAQVIHVAADLASTRPPEGIFALAGRTSPSSGPANIADLVALAKMLVQAEQDPVNGDIQNQKEPSR